MPSTETKLEVLKKCSKGEQNGLSVTISRNYQSFIPEPSLLHVQVILYCPSSSKGPATLASEKKNL